MEGQTPPKIVASKSETLENNNKDDDDVTDSAPSPTPNSAPESDDSESIIDVSGKNLDLSVSLFNGDASGSADGLYVYRNVFNLMPKSFGGRLKRLKFFANDVNLFPPAVSDLVDLQSLQVKVSSVGLNGLPFSKLKALKELELSRAPQRSSGFSILAEISTLKCLTKLSVCHFSVSVLGFWSIWRR